MRALKHSLQVTDRMGWNGDPCAPTTWNAWEGVTCRTNKDGNALVISQMYVVPVQLSLFFYRLFFFSSSGYALYCVMQ